MRAGFFRACGTVSPLVDEVVVAENAQLLPGAAAVWTPTALFSTGCGRYSIVFSYRLLGLKSS